MRLNLCVAAIMACNFAAAATPIDGWYASVFGGYANLPTNINTFTDGWFWHRPSFDGGYNAGGRAGYSSNPLRYEAEYTFLHAAARHFFVNEMPQTDVSGDSLANLIMANIYYDTVEILPAVTSFLGVGIGYANLHTALNSTGPCDLVHFRVSENEFAYQGTVGLTYNFSEVYALNIAYRYVATAESGNYGKIFQAHIANAGVIYHFDYGNYT